MATLRDRILTRAGAEAITHPGAIVAAGAGAAIGLAVGAPVAAAVGLGVLGWSGVVASRLPSDGPTRDLVDPMSVPQPWRRYVLEAGAAGARYRTAVRDLRRGPLRERLQDIGERVDAAVREVGRIADHGARLDRAAERLDDPAQLRARLEEARRDPSGGQVVASLESQLASTTRILEVRDSTRRRLELLDARLDELVARAVELSLQQAQPGAVAPIGADVEDLVAQMEGLRVALEDSGTT